MGFHGGVMVIFMGFIGDLRQEIHRKTIEPWEKDRKSHAKWRFFMGFDCVLPGLVNVYITNWKDPPFLVGKLATNGKV